MCTLTTHNAKKLAKKLAQSSHNKLKQMTTIDSHHAHMKHHTCLLDSDLFRREKERGREMLRQDLFINGISESVVMLSIMSKQ